MEGKMPATLRSMKGFHSKYQSICTINHHLFTEILICADAWYTVYIKAITHKIWHFLGGTF
jgi:hypothetical protein